MSLASLSSVQLHRLIDLVRQKEALQGKLSEIDRALEALENGSPETKREPRNKTRHRRRGANLKDAVLKKLKAAGKKGLTVKELATDLKANPGSISGWFYTTGKKIREIKSLGKARYAFLG